MTTECRCKCRVQNWYKRMKREPNTPSEEDVKLRTHDPRHHDIYPVLARHHWSGTKKPIPCAEPDLLKPSNFPSTQRGKRSRRDQKITKTSKYEVGGCRERDMTEHVTYFGIDLGFLPSTIHGCPVCVQRLHDVAPSGNSHFIYHTNRSSNRP